MSNKRPLVPRTLEAALPAVSGRRLHLQPIRPPMAPAATELMALPKSTLTQLRRYLAVGAITMPAELPARRRFPVRTRTGSNVVSLPFGVPRIVRAAALKRIAGGRRSDALLEQQGDIWAFVADDALVDLTDISRVFRVGQALIHS